MKKKRNTRATPQIHNTAPTYLIHDLTLVAPDRSQKDIGTLRDAIVSAEQVYFPNRALLYDL